MEVTTLPNHRQTPLLFAQALDTLQRQMADYLKAQGDRLRAARKSLGLSQEDAAHLIGVTVAAYGAWERGESEPRDRNWRKIEERLKVTAEEVRGEPPLSQMDQILVNQERILAELATIRVEQAAAEARLTTQLRSIARKLGTAAKGSQSQTGG